MSAKLKAITYSRCMLVVNKATEALGTLSPRCSLWTTERLEINSNSSPQSWWPALEFVSNV